MKKGLIMEGGAMRGMFTAGVTDVFLENNIEFDGAIGVSAGACFGCNFKSKQAGRVIRYNEKYCKDPRYCSMKSLIKTGNIFGAEFCYHEIPDKLDVFDCDTYNKNPMDFYIVATDIEKGKPIYRKCNIADDECFEWFRASASMPLVSEIVELDGYKLLDGGMSDSIPLKYFETIGYDRNVVILTQPYDYVKEKNKMMHAIRVAMRKYPQMITVMENRHEMYNMETEYIKSREKEGKVFVIRPPFALPVGHIEHEKDVLRNVYEIGRKTAMECLEDLKKFLKK